jgi:acyl-coenzyme A thioesterase PaaI-like protein
MSHDIRRRVLQGIALNRTPGFHFSGNFLGIELAEVGARTRVAMPEGLYAADIDGQLHAAAVFMVADIALAASIRAQLAPSSRLATVSMHVQLNGVPVRGALEARGEFCGFTLDAASKLGLARVTLKAGGKDVAFGHGTFMALDPPPGMTMHPVQASRARAVELPEEQSLDATERAILQRAQDAIEHGGTSFIARFLGIVPEKTADGATCRMENGAHVGNRVGHAQGGILMGLAASTARTALGTHWGLAGIAAAFTSPGEGDVLDAKASVIHRGRWTAVVHTEVVAPGGRRVLEVTTNHARRTE